MATGTDSDDPSPSSGRRPRSDLELEEGELVDSDLEDGELVASDDDSSYVLQHHHSGGGKDARPEIKRRRLEFEGIVVDGGALPSPTHWHDRDSGETVSDMDADARPRELLLFPCPAPAYRREFTSPKTVRAHPHGREQGNKERTPAMISGGWAVTGKRSAVALRSVFPNSEGVVDSLAMAAPEPVIDPMPTAFGSRSSRAESNPPNDDSIAIPVASSGNPTSQGVVRPPCSSQFLQGHQPAAPQAAVAQAQPTVAQGQQLAEAAAPQFFFRQPAAPLVVAPRGWWPPAPDEQGSWLCKAKGCELRFATSRGLCVHMASGRHGRKNNQAAAPVIDLGVRDAACAKPAKLHPCKYCTRDFSSEIRLVGHMRRHSRKVISRYDARPTVSAHELASSLAQALSLPMPPAAMEIAPAKPAVAPGARRIFGANMVPAGPPASAAEEVSSAVTETEDQSSAASTDIEQSAVAPSPPVVVRIFGVDIVVPPGAAANGTSPVVTETDQSPTASTNIEQ
jgi:hypothetical protein